MQNITIVFTVHKENGKCNSAELYKIIEVINPEVIFEEVSPDNFEYYYNEIEKEESLEVRCIKKYLLSHKIQHIPVDIDPDANLSTNDINYMFQTFQKNHEYAQCKEQIIIKVAQYGFQFLNSTEYLNLLSNLEKIEEGILRFNIYNNILSRTYKLFHAEQNNRENKMLENIYEYCENNQFCEALFLIGTGHRKGILKKISENQKRSTSKLNWKLFEK